jgi:C-terminal processing protease CtpA/Prc
MAAFMAEVFAALESSAAERLIIDLRHNSGGNSAVLGRFVPDLAAHPRLAAPGSLRVLVGSQTYSSGMTNAWELRSGARARLYGEPTGGKPNSWGEMRTFVLPRSGLEVSYSTQFFRKLETDPPAVEPDVLVPLTSADWFAGVDPVLERALRE